MLQDLEKAVAEEVPVNILVIAMRVSCDALVVVVEVPVNSIGKPGRVADAVVEGLLSIMIISEVGVPPVAPVVEVLLLERAGKRPKAPYYANEKS